jgi:predicted ATP-dependent serine protease
MTAPKEVTYRCQFCGTESVKGKWVGDKCPKCNRPYDPLLAQEMDD